MSMRDRLGLTVPQAIAAWALALFIGGMAGFMSMLICFYLLSFGGEDDAQKHGISKVQATRLGGVAVASYLLMHLWFQHSISGIIPSVEGIALISVSLCFFGLGLFEDLFANLSSKRRFSIMLSFAFVAVVAQPLLSLSPPGIPVVDALLGWSTISGVVCTALCIGFIPNAFNTADGANGLVAGSAAFIFVALITQAPATIVPALSAALLGCLLFLVFNLMSGRFFLGDGGAYFLGALAGLSVIVMSNQTDVSVWWLLTLIFYPVADLLWSIGRRLADGRSPFEPDNQHLHNLLFAYLSTESRASSLANTVTGVSIATIFGAAPALLVIAGVADPTSPAWVYWMLGQCYAYVAFWQHLTSKLCLVDAKLS